ncbi:uncharacterized protein LOC114524285 isoform X2 [Dendronephthya gigantea]|uniref:uncharacterized protein LOC114524285 isoform X2 n=1 Tax=Dendronephthya gigantea TaxID=151771 RepID=UPI00106C12CF|nr:uncharacterized protein LOC114524285 isoform X2 [Dendronephthya gigantea]
MAVLIKFSAKLNFFVSFFLVLGTVASSDELTVSESYYRKNYKKNPKNLQSSSDYCNKAQRRYKLPRDHYFTPPKFKYVGYEQCLPGCVVKKNVTFYPNFPTTTGDISKFQERRGAGDIRRIGKNFLRCCH